MKADNIIRCFCIWSDLLGFGNAFEEGQWTFANESTQKNIERLVMLEHALYNSNDPAKEVAFVLNDGMARVYDWPTKDDASNFLWWLNSAIFNHWLVNSVDINRGNPGVRSVISFGERVNTWKGNKTWGEHFFGDSEYKKSAEKKICVYSPEEFQLNLAFSKAYTIESVGSKGGLSGPGLFVDQVVLNAIEEYLTSGLFKFLHPVGTTETSDGAILHYNNDDVNYFICKYMTEDIYKFEINRKLYQSDGQVISRQVIAIEFDLKPIIISKRGINTQVHSVKKFNPIDEAEPFFFDFDNYVDSCP